MARLALFAILLLATVPSFGRLLSTRANAMASAWTALCTASGLQHVAWQGSDAVPDAPAPAGHPRPDCAYCPLLAGIVLAFAWLAVALQRVPASVLCTCLHVFVRQPLHPCGLGSRGPPLPL
jgi:hypothetical protein